MVVATVKSDQPTDKDGYHLVHNGLIEISGSSCRHTMHGIVQSSKCNFTVLENSETCYKVEALQIPLMVMLGS